MMIKRKNLDSLKKKAGTRLTNRERRKLQRARNFLSGGRRRTLTNC